MPADPAVSTLDQFVRALDLKGRRDHLLWGVWRGFPLGLTLTDGSAQSDALFHLRYAEHAFARGEEPKLEFAEPLPRLMDEGWAEVEIRDDLAWLTLKRFGDRLQRDEVVPALDSLIGCLRSLGIEAVATCHYCGGAEQVTTVASKGRVGQICAKCIEEQIGPDVNRLGFRARSLAPLALLAPLVLLLQSGLWGGIWIGVDWVFEKLGGSIHIHSLAAGFVVLVLAYLAASPAFLFRLVANRGNRRAGLLGAACALLAVPLGELFHVVQQFGTYSVIGPVLKHPTLIFTVLNPGDGLFGILKLLTIAGFIGMSVSWAKPKKIELEL
ncbi:MAG: hypothetical protein JSR82_20205 [Verrucomicrobia bacterium]|nr:hypothetical protein [Verrucomicrobiota bacterium]